MSYSIKALSKIAPIAASLGFGMLLAQPAIAIRPLDIRPILRNVTNAQEIISGPIPNVQYSFGYAFNVNEDGWLANALGFGFQNNWLGGSDSTTYQVSLWSVLFDDPDPNAAPIVTELASATFDPTDATLADNLFAGIAPNQGLYYWLEIPRTSLPNSSANPDFYYLVGASGRFAGQGAIKPRVEGVPNFPSPVATYVFEGFNDQFDIDFPAPLLEFPDSNFAGKGFWNANVSLEEIPGPLPLMGVAAAFGWSRRLKKKMSQRNSEIS